MNVIARSMCVCGLLTVVALPSEASDKKIYPASACQVSSESDGGVAFYNDQGRIYNNSATGSLTVLCPVVRDNTTTGWQSAWVVVRNPQPAGTNVSVWCTLYNRHSNGTLNKMQDRYLASTTDTGWRTLTFDSFPAVDNGYHLLVCRLPARHGSQNSGITSYSVTEISAP